MSDIFQEIKEAVLQATPGEDTRNYYRNQGMAIERERIIKIFETTVIEYDKIMNEDFAHGSIWASMSLLKLIKGETE